MKIHTHTPPLPTLWLPSPSHLAAHMQQGPRSLLAILLLLSAARLMKKRNDIEGARMPTGKKTHICKSQPQHKLGV